MSPFGYRPTGFPLISIVESYPGAVEIDRSLKDTEPPDLEVTTMSTVAVEPPFHNATPWFSSVSSPSATPIDVSQS